ncbi:right-handed parallel beta-helix repeat-containing protein [Chitinophagaceae bacterium 26-R-25]|nr:right-handed parallel beta-helix repeat-containing protein [Chitinophagaceae bacterium 26-R-25]
MKSFFTALFACSSLIAFAQNKSASSKPFKYHEYHVSVNGNDNNDGSVKKPLKTIMAAANKAMPGDVVTVHAGIYRETVAPPRGGESPSKRITYQAAKGEKVIITGSEPVTGWTREQHDTWKTVIPNKFFGGYNPFADSIAGDWFHSLGRPAHTGSVYMDDQWLKEATALNKVLEQSTSDLVFFAEVGLDSTVVHAQFPGKDPNKAQVEVNVRQTVFYPKKNFINYITVRGFILQNAAPNWAPPTIEQKAIIGTNWSKGWIIENNLIRHSACTGLSLGKYGDDWGNNGPGYADWDRTIERALRNGWNKDSIGHHLVRNNEIRECDEVGIVGAFGGAYSIIENNHIHDIGVRGLLGGAELAGIKFHGAIDTYIRDNWIHHCIRGMHLDWMTQGTQITGNLMHNNDGQPSGKVGFYEAGGGQDIFLEVNHGPCLIANNILLSGQSIFNASHGTAFVHNLMRKVDPTLARWLPRKTPYLVPHGTAIAGQYDNRGGDDRFFNNIFVAPAKLTHYDTSSLPIMMEGNVFTKGTLPSAQEKKVLRDSSLEPKPHIEIRNGEAWLSLSSNPAWRMEQERRLVTTELLGRATVPQQAFENSDGSALRIDTDYFDKKRKATNPFPGPFETPVNGEIKVWPK